MSLFLRLLVHCSMDDGLPAKVVYLALSCSSVAELRLASSAKWTWIYTLSLLMGAQEIPSCKWAEADYPCHSEAALGSPSCL